MPKISDQNEYDENSIHYPDDLATGYTHPDCVKFTIMTNPGLSLKPIAELTKKKVKSAKNRIIKSKRESLNNEAETLREERKALNIQSSEGKTQPNLQRFEQINARLKNIRTESGERITPTALEITGELASNVIENPGETIDELGSAFYQGNKKNVFTSLKSIFLPMPENLVYNEQVDWQGTDLGVMKGAVDALAEGGGSSSDAVAGAALGQAGNVLAGGAGAIVSKLLGGSVLGGAVLGGLGGGSNLQGAIESKLRVKTNPFKEQTFQGIGFRPFEFSFVFNARSQSEVHTIRKIINSFRKYSKPSLLAGSSDNIFNYPAEFQIEFLTIHQGGLIENEYLPKLHRCICKSVNTNFTTAGWRSFEDGAPTTITLQLGFEEVDIVTAGQVEIDGDGF